MEPTASRYTGTLDNGCRQSEDLRSVKEWWEEDGLENWMDFLNLQLDG